MKKLLVSLALGLSVLAAGTTGFAQTPAAATAEAPPHPHRLPRHPRPLPLLQHLPQQQLRLPRPKQPHLRPHPHRPSTRATPPG
jgi:hypothetical protein